MCAQQAHSPLLTLELQTQPQGGVFRVLQLVPVPEPFLQQIDGGLITYVLQVHKHSLVPVMFVQQLLHLHVCGVHLTDEEQEQPVEQHHVPVPAVPRDSSGREKRPGELPEGMSQRGLVTHVCGSSDKQEMYIKWQT